MANANRREKSTGLPIGGDSVNVWRQREAKQLTLLRIKGKAVVVRNDIPSTECSLRREK